MPQQASSPPRTRPGVVDRAWLLGVLDRRGMSQRQLAKRLKVDAASVSRLANGRRHVTFEEVVALARILAVPVREVIEHAGIDLSAAAVPLADYVVDFGDVMKLAGPEGG